MSALCLSPESPRCLLWALVSSLQAPSSALTPPSAGEVREGDSDTSGFDFLLNRHRIRNQVEKVLANVI